MLGELVCRRQGGVICAAVVDDDDVLRTAGLLRQTAQARERTLAAVEVCKYGADFRHGRNYATERGHMQGKSCFLPCYVGLLCCFSEL